MIAHLPLLSISAAVAALFYAGLPSPSPTRSPPIDWRAGQVVSGSAGIAMDGSFTLRGSAIELVGTALASPSEICADADGHTASCDTSIERFIRERASGDQVICWMETDEALAVSARCSIDGSDLNAMLVHAGLARANPLSASDYVELEAEARESSSGLWKTAADHI